METANVLDLFQLTETEQLKVELHKLRKELSNVRRGLFSRHEELLKMYVEAKDEIEQLRSFVEGAGAIEDKKILKSTTRLYFAN